jgi:predicted dehydrogenase
MVDFQPTCAWSKLGGCIVQTIKLAIIGTGIIGSLYARICKQIFGVEVVAIHDVNEKRAEDLAKELGTKAYTDLPYNPVFVENPEIDAALICTPQDHHVEPTLAALRAGKHIQLEKPLAANVKDARKLVSAISQHNVLSMVNYSLRFDPRYVAMKEAIQAGEVGTIRYIHARRNPPFASVSNRVRPGHEELPFWVGVHDIDMMRWITGSEVAKIYATNTSIGYGHTGLFGAILTNLVFHNGVIAVLENAWREITSSTSRLLSIASFRVHGTRGVIEIDSEGQGIRIIEDGVSFTPDTVSMPEVASQIVGTYRNQTEHFIRCLRENRSTGIPPTDGLMGVVVAEAILKSLKEGREIHLAEEYPGNEI